MNYKEYFNDIDDFDPESQRLIRSSQSSIIALRSQKYGKYGSIQNPTVGKIQRGEKIRGMNNVSPLATVKFFNQTSNEIFNKYFPDGKDITKGNTTIIKDAKVVTKGGYDFDAHDFFSDKNRDGSINHDEELTFKLLIFVSDDGNKVRECYDVVKPADDEIILFLETDVDNLSSQKLYGRISEKVRKTYLDTKTGKLYRTFFEGDIVEITKKYLNQANKELIEELLLRGYIEDKGIGADFVYGLKYVLLATSAPAKALGWVMHKLGNGIDFLKISDEFWDTENENYYFQKDKLIENLSISTDKLSPLKNLFTDKKGFNLADLTPQMLDDIILKQVSVIESFVGQYNSYVKATVDELFKTMENPEIQIRVEILSEKVALICGIWNGLVDFVSSIFKFLGMLLEAPFEITEDFEQILEMIDNFWEMSRNGTLWENIETAISTGMTKMVEYLKSKNADEVNWVRINYVAGFTIAFVGTFFIPIANIAKVANTGKVGEILAKITSEIGNTVSKTSKFVKIQTAEAYQKTSNALLDLLELFKTGGQKLQTFVDDIWKKIAEWFLKNKTKELIDEIYDFIKVLKKNFNYVECIRLANKNRVFALWMAVEYEAMIKFYTGNVYQILNKALRGVGGVKMTKDLEAMRKVLDKALEKLPPSIYNEGILQRSLSLTELEIKNLFKVGKDFTEKGFMSTTYSEAVLLDWMAVNPADNVIIKVMGKNGKLIEDASLLPHEAEVLFKSNTTFVVKSVNAGYNFKLGRKITEIILKEK